MLTGDDYTSKFGTKYLGLLCDPVAYLLNFAKKIDSDSIDEAIVSAEKYLVQFLKRGSHCITMDQLRLWMYYWNNKKNLEDLPPTSRSVREHILRSLFCTYNQIMCLESQTNLDSTLFGYKSTEGCLLPTTGVILYPDEDELVPSCGCLKCARKSCCCTML